MAQPRISQSLKETDPGEELQPLDADGDVIMEPETGETQAEEKKMIFCILDPSRHQ